MSTMKRGLMAVVATIGAALAIAPASWAEVPAVTTGGANKVTVIRESRATDYAR